MARRQTHPSTQRTFQANRASNRVASGSSASQQIAPSNGNSPARMSPTASTPRGLGRTRNTDTRESRPNIRPATNMIREHDHAGQALTAIQNVEEADVSHSVFVTTSGSVSFYNEGGPPRQPPNSDDSSPTGSDVSIHSSSPTITTPDSSEHSEYEIYCKYLLVKQRGSPLWEPGPQMLLRTEHRRTGIRIGDVGILKPTTGCFAFLFNIFLPADHEINEGRVPDGFVPLDKSKAERYFSMSIPFRRGNCLASSSLRRTEPSSEFSFQTTDREGAVLVMPDGAVSVDLENHTLVENYIAANAKLWWKHVESDACGMQNQNIIQVVVGTDKVSCWGMATFQNVNIARPLEFTLGDDGTASQVRTYQWRGIASSRAGPSEEEMHDLLSGPTTPLRNQCVFIRTLNVSLSIKARAELAVREVCSTCFRASVPDSDSPGPQHVNIQSSDAAGRPVAHPPTFLNEYLLEKCPNTDIVITRDSDWISVITENETTLLSVEDICARVLDSHVICEKEGVATLEKRNGLCVVTPQPSMAGTSVTLGNNESKIGKLWIHSSKNGNDSGKDIDSADKLAEPSGSDVDEHFSKSALQSMNHFGDDQLEGFKHPEGLECVFEEKNEDIEVIEPILPPASCVSLSDNILYLHRTKDDAVDLSMIKTKQPCGDRDLVVDFLAKPMFFASKSPTMSIPSAHQVSHLHQRRATKPSRSSAVTKLTQALRSSMRKLSTSMASFSSSLHHARTPRLDLEVPNGSLSVDTLSILSSGLYRTKPPKIDFAIPSHLLSMKKASTDSFSNDPFQYLSPIEQAIQSRLRTFHVVDGVVTAGTLEGLVQFLITKSEHIYDRDTFLTACSELTTPDNLFPILYRLFKERHTDDGVGRQIFLFIIYWLNSDCFSPNEETLYRIKFFCEEARYPKLDVIARQTCQLIDDKMARPRVRNTYRRQPVLKSSQIKPRDIAVALGLLEGDLYKVLQPSDYLLHLSKGQSDRVDTYYKTNEKIKLWVIRSILHFDTVRRQVEVMKFFINTALECYAMRNFSSTVAISSALHSDPIEDLTATREALPKDILAKLHTLSEVILPHRGYRDAIRAAATIQERNTCVPWLAVHLAELDKVVRLPLTVRVDDQHLINFIRYDRFMERTKEILHYLPPDLEDKRHGHRGQLTYLLNQLRHIHIDEREVERLKDNGVYVEHFRRTDIALTKS